MEQTTHFQLNQWAASDRIQREDFNADNAKIETALADLDQRTEALETAGFGNCRLYCAAYAGDGKTSRTFTFPKPPKLVLLYGGVYVCLASAGSTVSGCHAVNGAGKEGTAAWSGSSVTLAFPGAHYLCNSQGLTYQLAAWIAADE